MGHKEFLFPKKEFTLNCESGLRGSLFLGLLVLDFDHPTNRGLYLVDGVGEWVGGLGSLQK